MLQTTLAGDAILINNASKPIKVKQEPAKPTKREGVVYINPATGQLFEEPLLTCEYISELSQSNVYARGVLNKLLWLIFTGEPDIEIKDPSGQVVPPGTPAKPSVYNDVMNMLDAPDVDMWCRMQDALCDSFWWGNCILNPVWEYVGNIYTLISLARLAPESFTGEPDEGEIYNPLLKGITLLKGKPTYYFIDDEGNSKKLSNYHSIQPPQSTKLGGSPMVQPLLLTIAYLNQAWTAMGQTMNRAGAPSMWLRVTDGDEDTFTYLREVLKNWGKNTSFPLPENVEILDPHITEPQNTQEAIKLLQNLLIDYFSPVSLLNAGDSGAAFDSSAQKSALIMAFIQGMHKWLEDGFEKLLQTYLIANKYVGYSIRITLPMPETDTTESDQAWVTILANAQTVVVDENEIRRFIPGVDQLDDAGIAALRERQATPQPVVSPPAELVANATALPTATEQSAYEALSRKADSVKQAVIDDLRKQGFAI